jgi:hypothetical protein
MLRHNRLSCVRDRSYKTLATFLFATVLFILLPYEKVSSMICSIELGRLLTTLVVALLLWVNDRPPKYRSAKTVCVSTMLTFSSLLSYQNMDWFVVVILCFADEMFDLWYQLGDLRNSLVSPCD